VIRGALEHSHHASPVTPLILSIIAWLTFMSSCAGRFVLDKRERLIDAHRAHNDSPFKNPR
jgi:hypothetical protein